MANDLPYLIPLAGTAVLVVLYFLIRSWGQGLFHPVVSVVSLISGAAAVLFTYHRAPALFEAMNMAMTAYTLLGFALLVGVLVLVFFRKTGHAMIADAYSNNFSVRLFTGPGGAFLSLVPAALFIVFLAVALRYQATFSELRYIDHCSELYSHGATTYPDTPYTIKLRDALDDIPRSTEFLDQIGLYGPAAPRHLVGLALISRNYDLFLAVGRDANALQVYAHPRVTALLAALPVTKLLDKKEHRPLLSHKMILDTAALPGLSENLTQIDVIGTLQRTLGIK